MNIKDIQFMDGILSSFKKINEIKTKAGVQIEVSGLEKENHSDTLRKYLITNSFSAINKMVADNQIKNDGSIYEIVELVMQALEEEAKIIFSSQEKGSIFNNAFNWDIEIKENYKQLGLDNLEKIAYLRQELKKLESPNGAEYYKNMRASKGFPAENIASELKTVKTNIENQIKELEGNNKVS